MKRASVQPRAAPCLATSRISSMRMKARCPTTGGCAKVQYPHLSLHSRVSGKNTCTQTEVTFRVKHAPVDLSRPCCMS